MKDAEARIKKAQGARLAALRKLAGYRSAREAAIENGWAESSYSAHERGSRTIGQDDAERYARLLKHRGAKTASASLILFGNEPATTQAEQESAAFEVSQANASSSVLRPMRRDPLLDNDCIQVAIGELQRQIVDALLKLRLVKGRKKEDDAAAAAKLVISVLQESANISVVLWLEQHDRNFSGSPKRASDGRA